MKDQYVGDVNDYCKYGLLRRLAADRDLGIFWMLTAPDGRSDGKFVEYLRKPVGLEKFDSDLFRKMQIKFGDGRNRNVRAVEEARLLSRAKFYSGLIPDSATEREKVMKEGLESLASCGIIFFDPDNGLEVPSVPMGRKNSSKYIYHDELAQVSSQSSIVVYQHFPRVHRDAYISYRKEQLAELVSAEKVFTLCTGRVCYFLIARAGMAGRMEKTCREMISRWRGVFSCPDL